MEGRWEEERRGRNNAIEERKAGARMREATEIDLANRIN